MKVQHFARSISLVGFLLLSCFSSAAELDRKLPNETPQANANFGQLFSPLKALRSPTCLLYCIQLPGGFPQKCFFDPSVPQCAVLNHK